MKNHLHSCTEFLEKGGGNRKPNLKDEPEEDEDKAQVDQNKFVNSSPEELEGMGFFEPAPKLNKRCSELWVKFLVNNETGEAVCKACLKTFTMVRLQL